MSKSLADIVLGSTIASQLDIYKFIKESPYTRYILFCKDEIRLYSSRVQMAFKPLGANKWDIAVHDGEHLTYEMKEDTLIKYLRDILAKEIGVNSADLEQTIIERSLSLQKL